MAAFERVSTTDGFLFKYDSVQVQPMEENEGEYGRGKTSAPKPDCQPTYF
jgi:hypothetical protein